MCAKETNDKEDKATSNNFGFTSMGQMFEMMSKCCAARGGFPDCSTAMEGLMETMKKQRCTPSKDGTESGRRKK